MIADLPCSGLGVMGKKYDIKYKLTQNQQKELVELQRKILNVVSEYVKPGGKLIYSTCTVNRHENIENMEWFLANHEFEAESIDDYLPEALHSDTTKAGYLQLLQESISLMVFHMQNEEKKVGIYLNIKSLYLDELINEMKLINQPAFRAKQILNGYMLNS